MNRADALPLVSVVIPTRNRAELLEAALLSVMAQEGIGTEFDIEILVIDDGSTDRTPDLVRGYPDVHYYRGEESRGTSAARNRGVTEARGQYVAFLDDDDTWLPWKLRRQIAVLERDEQIGLVYGQEIKRGDESVTVWPDLRDGRTGWMQRSLLTSCPVNTSSTVVRRVAFDHAGLFDELDTCRRNIPGDLRLVADDGATARIAATQIVHVDVRLGTILMSQGDVGDILDVDLERSS